MLTSELSMIIIPLIFIIGVIASYAAFITKFKPKMEKESEFSEKVKQKEELLPKSKITIKQTETKKNTNIEPKMIPKEAAVLKTEKPIIKPPKTEKKKTGFLDGEIETLMQDLKIKETQKRDKEKTKPHRVNEEAKKAFLLFGMKHKFDGCPYFFGHLHELIEENSPIPDECYGCPKMMECV
jgi:hypothetical protein